MRYTDKAPGMGLLFFNPTPKRGFYNYKVVDLKNVVGLVNSVALK
jgi:hypothetical protein